MTESPSAGDHQSGELGGSRGAGEATPDFGVAESELGPPFFRVLSAGARPGPVPGALLHLPHQRLLLSHHELLLLQHHLLFHELLVDEDVTAGHPRLG